MAQPLIAVIDNDPHIVTFLGHLLADEGYRTITRMTGDGARAIIERERPALVILDLWMEQRNTGWRVLDQLRSSPATADIPILLCSADIHALRARTAELRMMGCETLEKPFSIGAIMEKIEQMIGGKSAVSSRQSAVGSRP